MEFVPMPELPTQPPTSMTLTEWMDSLRKGWENTKKALTEAAKNYKVQADKHRSLQPPFKVGDKVYLSTKYLRLKLASKKLGPKFLGLFPIKKIILLRSN
uniref:Uncharacterized protein n=1 Tax=Micrurus lemniscatus lemniscatus TaxID=129467 RepID=A0A2D4I6Z9_MICLE